MTKTKQDVGVVLLLSTPGGRDTLRKVGPHDTEGVWCTLARFHRSCMGLYSGLLHPMHSVKWIKIMLLLHAKFYYNIYEHEHDMDMIMITYMITTWYVYDIVYDRYNLCIKLRLRCYIVDNLGNPQSSDEETCHEWLMFRSRCVKRILTYRL